MNVVVHYPKSQENLRVLQKKMAVAHAEAVLRYIQKLPCPKDQKLELITALKKKGLQ